MDNIVVQAITELGHGLSQKPAETTLTLTNENGVWWFVQQCTVKTRVWLFGSLGALLFGALSIGYFVGHNRALSQLMEAWNHR